MSLLLLFGPSSGPGPEPSVSATRTVTPSIELGLGGSFIAQALTATTHYKGWSMRVINGDLSVAQQANVASSYPTGWSNGDTLNIFGSPLLRQPSALPEGGSAIRLNGTSQYLASVYDESASPNDIGPQSLECIVEIHAVPSVGVEPAVMGGSTEFAVTARSDGRLYGYYNGAAVVDLPFTVDEPLHIVLTRSDTSPDSVNLYVNNVVDSATPANGTINRGYVHFGKHWTNAHYLNATYSLGWFYAAELSPAQVAAHYAAGIWTDVTVSARTGVPITIERGIKDDTPIARVGATGIATFALNNFQPGAAGTTLGYYTPGHANVRSGFTKGIPCRITMTAESTEYPQFVGRVRRIAPLPNEFGERLTHITATDWMDEAARFRLAGTALLEDVTADEVVAAIVERMPNQPHGLTLHPCSETYDLALDNSQDEEVTALEEFVRLQNSEVGRGYVSREGTLVWESRYTRPEDYADVDVDIDGRLIDLDAAEITDGAVNRVQVTVHPREVDDTPTVLFAITRPIEVLSLETVTITGTYTTQDEDIRVGGLDMVVPVAGTDYAAFAFDDGSGTSYTSDLSVAAEFSANTVTFTLTNNRTTPGPGPGETTTAYVTLLQVRGRGVYDFQPIVLLAKNDEAIADDGVNPLSFDMPYQESPRVGQTIADMLLAAYQDSGVRARRLTLCANDANVPVDVLGMDVSNRITVQEAMTAINGPYHINGVRVEYTEGVACFISWWLATTAEGDELVP